MITLNEGFILIRGAGDLASGIAWRLYQVGFQIVMTEISAPTAIRRTVAFSEAIYEGTVAIEGVLGQVSEVHHIPDLLKAGRIPVVVDPDLKEVLTLNPDILIDARMTKGCLSSFRPTHMQDAPYVIGVGPGFYAGKDVHAVVETQRGHTLGRVILSGEALPNTGIPGMIAGESEKRVLRATQDGIFKTQRQIGEMVTAGEILALIHQSAVKASISGVLRGLLRSGSSVHSGMKVGDIDPRAQSQHCYTISDKSLSVAGGVMEAVLRFLYG